MNRLFIISSFLLSVVASSAQGNRVFSGGEIANYGIVNISAVGGIAWSTERTAKPGYFSIVNTATYVGCSDDANIDGYIKKYGNTAYIFPVGSGTDVRTLEISAPAAITDAYATAWIEGNPSLNLDPTSPNAGPHSIYEVSTPIVAISPIGQWDWQVGDAGNLGNGTTGTGAGLTITVSIPDMTSFAPAPYLRLVGWNGKKWIDLSGKSSANVNTENGTLSGTMVEGITAIAIGRVISPYVVILEKFDAISSNCKAVVNWNTSNESNTEMFIVEQSFDAFTFHTIASVKATGSSIGSTYSIAIAQPAGDAYYRLKMMNFDGSFIYSSTILNRNTCVQTDNMVVYPNPVSSFEDINISFTTNYRGQADFILFNGIGQRMLSKPIQVTDGLNFVSTNVKRLSAGTYFIVVLNENGNQIGGRQKFIKQ